MIDVGQRETVGLAGYSPNAVYPAPLLGHSCGHFHGLYSPILLAIYQISLTRELNIRLFFEMVELQTPTWP